MKSENPRTAAASQPETSAGSQEKARVERTTLVPLRKPDEARSGDARILLVEDNLTNQEVAAGMLRRLGLNTDVTSDGRQALQALESQPYDLVLMDLQMPRMDGYEATRRIRDPRSPVLDHNIPVIALTADSMAGDAEKCFAAGMSDYITKPVDATILAAVVNKWLMNRTHHLPSAPAVDLATPAVAPLATAMKELRVFNCESFLRRMMGDEGFAGEVAAEFLNELPTLIRDLKEGLARNDLESVWKQAHKIKGSAANVGGEALRDAALEIEKNGVAGDQAGVARRIPELERQDVLLRNAIQQWRRSTARP